MSLSIEDGDESSNSNSENKSTENLVQRYIELYKKNNNNERPILEHKFPDETWVPTFPYPRYRDEEIVFYDFYDLYDTMVTNGGCWPGSNDKIDDENKKRITRIYENYVFAKIKKLSLTNVDQENVKKEILKACPGTCEEGQKKCEEPITADDLYKLESGKNIWIVPKKEGNVCYVDETVEGVREANKFRDPLNRRRYGIDDDVESIVKYVKYLLSQDFKRDGINVLIKTREKMFDTILFLRRIHESLLEKETVQDFVRRIQEKMNEIENKIEELNRSQSYVYLIEDYYFAYRQRLFYTYTEDELRGLLFNLNLIPAELNLHQDLIQKIQEIKKAIDEIFTENLVVKYTDLYKTNKKEEPKTRHEFADNAWVPTFPYPRYKDENLLFYDFYDLYETMVLNGGNWPGSEEKIDDENKKRITDFLDNYVLPKIKKLSPTEDDEGILQACPGTCKAGDDECLETQTNDDLYTLESGKNIWIVPEKKGNICYVDATVEKVRQGNYFKDPSTERLYRIDDDVESIVKYVNHLLSKNFADVFNVNELTDAKKKMLDAISFLEGIDESLLPKETLEVLLTRINQKLDDLINSIVEYVNNLLSKKFNDVFNVNELTDAKGKMLDAISLLEIIDESLLPQQRVQDLLKRIKQNLDDLNEMIKDLNQSQYYVSLALSHYESYEKDLFKTYNQEKIIKVLADLNFFSPEHDTRPEFKTKLEKMRYALQTRFQELLKNQTSFERGNGETDRVHSPRTLRMYQEALAYGVEMENDFNWLDAMRSLYVDIEEFESLNAEKLEQIINHLNILLGKYDQYPAWKARIQALLNLFKNPNFYQNTSGAISAETLYRNAFNEAVQSYERRFAEENIPTTVRVRPSQDRPNGSVRERGEIITTNNEILFERGNGETDGAYTPRTLQMYQEALAHGVEMQNDFYWLHAMRSLYEEYQDFESLTAQRLEQIISKLEFLSTKYKQNVTWEPRIQALLKVFKEGPHGINHET